MTVTQKRSYTCLCPPIVGLDLVHPRLGQEPLTNDGRSAFHTPRDPETRRTDKLLAAIGSEMLAHKGGRMRELMATWKTS